MANRCPLCRAPMPGGAANCPRCGARIAALPRRPRPHPPRFEYPDPATEAAATPAGDSAAAHPSLAAGVRGAVIGVGLVTACAVLAILASVLGRSAYAAFGNSTLAAGGVCIVAAALVGGIHFRRWDEFAAMRERLESGRSVGSRRVTLLSAGFLLIAASGLTAALVH